MQRSVISLKAPKALVFAFGLVLSTVASAVDVSDSSNLDLSLEELMSVVVTSVSKKEQTLAETAAAVHVITADDIRRSGATNVPEALRLAPGVQVAAIGNNKWAVAIRGFADRFSSKLLVLVDGRSVYTPLFSGVFWEGLSVPLEEIERIEVMRGPGAAIWGSNAVNGVINIITRSAHSGQGQLALATGSELKSYAFARQAWRPDPDTAISVHARMFDKGSSQRRDDGGRSNDDWRGASAGFKFERMLSRGTLMLNGGVSRTRADDELFTFQLSPQTGMPFERFENVREHADSDHLLARWENVDDDGSEDSLQMYLEHARFNHSFIKQSRATADIEYQSRIRFGERHDLTWGVGYRHHRDRIDGSFQINVGERRSSTSLYSVFVQDEITLQPERWRVIVGARLEHNDYTGYGFQPNARLLWTPDARNSLWMSAARALRTPSRIERGGKIVVGMGDFGPDLPLVLRFDTPALDDERVDAIDVGWRHQFNPATSVDLTLFHARHTRQRGAALEGEPPLVPPGYLLFAAVSNNDNYSNVSGLEVGVDWRASRDWRLQAHYSWVRDEVGIGKAPGQVFSNYAGATPRHQFSLRSAVDLGPNLQWDTWLRYVSEVAVHSVPAYTTLDMRLAWKAQKNLTLALVGQNLLDPVHPEYGNSFVLSRTAELERAVYLRADWAF